MPLGVSLVEINPGSRTSTNKKQGPSSLMLQQHSILSHLNVLNKSSSTFRKIGCALDRLADVPIEQHDFPAVTTLVLISAGQEQALVKEQMRGKSRKEKIYIG